MHTSSISVHIQIIIGELVPQLVQKDELGEEGVGVDKVWDLLQGHKCFIRKVHKQFRLRYEKRQHSSKRKVLRRMSGKGLCTPSKD